MRPLPKQAVVHAHRLRLLSPPRRFCFLRSTGAPGSPSPSPAPRCNLPTCTHDDKPSSGFAWQPIYMDYRRLMCSYKHSSTLHCYNAPLFGAIFDTRAFTARICSRA